jgi:flavin-binding protein dodecin
MASFVQDGHRYSHDLKRSAASDDETERSIAMSAHPGTIYRTTELVGTSNIGFDDAVKRAVERAQKTLRNLAWFEVHEQRGRLTDGRIEYQVTLAVGFALEDTMT